MNEKKPLLDEWKTLYELISKLKTIGPWQWLEEQDIFAVQNPETGEIGFVSVMGSIGEHYSVSVYRGEEGLRKFWDFQETDIDDLAYQRLLEMPQLQASFEDRDYLHKEDRDLIKKLSLTFRGKQSWLMFRSYIPGFVPWFITSSEARFLICALQINMLLICHKFLYLLHKRVVLSAVSSMKLFSKFVTSIESHYLKCET